MIFSGELVPAPDALRSGLVDRVVPDGALFAHSLEWAARLAHGPSAVRGLAKQVIDRGLDLPLDAGLRLELDVFPRLFEDWATA